MRRRARIRRQARSATKARPVLGLTRHALKRIVGFGGLAVLGVAGVATLVVGVTRLEARVERNVRGRAGPATLTFLDLPEPLDELALPELHAMLAPFLRRDWLEERLCEEMVGTLTASGWVRRVRFVRRAAGAVFEIAADYRVPVALVQYQGKLHLVDAAGARLPGEYRAETRWKLVRGVAHAPPGHGELWPGDDLRAGLGLLVALQTEPFYDQLTAVVVDNFGGRRNPRRSQIELATDQSGGRILWGSALGQELEENTFEQKTALLRANLHGTGRVDAGHLVIDVSTFPDRFTTPG